MEDFRRLCEGEDDDTEDMEVSGVSVRMEMGGVVHDDKVNAR